MSETHVTEWGLAVCADLLYPKGRSHSHPAAMARMRRLGLRKNAQACDGSDVMGRWLPSGEVEPTNMQCVLFTVLSRNRIPSCPRCQMLRESALQGVLLVGWPPVKPNERGTPPAEPSPHGPKDSNSPSLSGTD